MAANRQQSANSRLEEEVIKAEAALVMHARTYLPPEGEPGNLEWWQEYRRLANRFDNAERALRHAETPSFDLPLFSAGNENASV